MDNISRSRSRAIILKIKFLGLGLVQKFNPSYYSVSVSSKKSGLVPPCKGLTNFIGIDYYLDFQINSIEVGFELTLLTYKVFLVQGCAE